MTVLGQALLAAGVLVVAVSALGLLLARNPSLRLHFLAPATSLGVPLVLAAVLLAHGPLDDVTAKLVTVLVVLVVTSPVATMAVARSTARQGAPVEEDEHG